jgi:hypothetical protein
LARIITSLQPVTASTSTFSEGARGMLKQLIIIGVLGLALAGCQTVAEGQTQGAREDVGACKNLSFETADGMLLKRRLWVGDGTDSASKLTDPLPLTQSERDALARYTASVLPCRQIVAEHDGTDSVGAMPAAQTFWARTDEIRTKLEAGEIAVGAANRLQMQAWDAFRIAQGQAKSTVANENDPRQQAAATHTNCAMANGQVNCTAN